MKGFRPDAIIMDASRSYHAAEMQPPGCVCLVTNVVCWLAATGNLTFMHAGFIQ